MSLPRLLNEPGPVLTYLSKLKQINPALADATVAAVQSLLRQPDGAILLDLLEKSTTLLATPILADDRALFARNAQAILASDLRRITSDEHEQVSGKDAEKRPGRSGR